MKNRFVCIALLTIGVYRLATGRPTDSGRIVIRPADMAPAFATPSADNGPRIVRKPANAELKLPQGFKAEIWAEGFDNPRWMAVAPNGDVFVTEAHANRLTILRDADSGGKATVHSTFADGLNQPFGIGFYKDWVYVANTNSVVRFKYKPGQLKADGPPETVVPVLPGGGYHGHWTRDLMFNSRTGKMLVTCGSHVDIGLEPDPHRAAILEFNPDGSGERVLANGIRNPVGIALQPGTGQLWASVNERDGMGDDTPPDYVTSIKDGGFYGWPYYYIGPNRDPRVPDERPELKDKVIVPDVLVQAHSAVLGLAFYTGKMFPKEYRNDIFVASHGSGNRSKRTGYKIIRVPFKNGKPIGGYEDFCTGWMLGENDKRAWGRPVGLVIAKDGSMLVADDAANRIWRISYSINTSASRPKP